ncbi:MULTISPECIES: hypothetical protein [Luteimonas]|uniref:hypothetical protein n=1 Tax=Luteimonas TaxID=83614 RepID=UPI00117C84C6|nr:MULTISPECIES: hypothetical protein [Luteimonas]
MTMHQDTQRVDYKSASELASLLRKLEQEFDRVSYAKPPTDEHLSKWESQANLCLKTANSSKSAEMPRVARQALRFLDQIEKMKARKAAYIIRRRTATSSSHFLHYTESTASLEQHTQSPLSASIKLSLENSNSDQDSEKESKDKFSLSDKEISEDTTAFHESITPFEISTSEATSERAHAAYSGRTPVTRRESNFRSPLANGAAREVKETLSRKHSWQVTPIIAVEGRLARENSFNSAREVALSWLRKKGFDVKSVQHDSFEAKSRFGHTTSVVNAIEHGLWAMQTETLDKSTPGRRWRVEMVLLDATPTPAITITLTAISPQDTGEPSTSIPGLVSDIVREIGILDVDEGAVFGSEPTIIDDHKSLQVVISSIKSSKRSRPLVVISTYTKNGLSKNLLRPSDLSRKLSGLAKVVVLSREMAWPFNELVSRKFAVAGAAIRMFRPDFSSDDEPGRHPIWSPTELTEQGFGLNALTGQLLRESAYSSLRALEREDAIPSFERVREMTLRRQIEQAREKVRDASKRATESTSIDAVKNELLEEKKYIELLEEDNSSLQSERDILISELSALRDQQDRMRARIHYLDSRVFSLEAQIREEGGPSEPTFPENWDDLDEWCADNLRDRVILTGKALRAARNSVFDDIPLAYRTLWLLSEYYVPARINGGEFRSEFAKLGLEISPVGNAVEDRRYSGAYQTPYKHETVKLDQHVKGKDNVDPRHGFRVYFHWHERDNCAIVGWLPSHLTNSLS